MENPVQSYLVKNTPLDMEKWREIITGWNKHCETQQAYCQRLGVSLTTFSYVRSKLLQQDKPKSQFIPLTIKNRDEEKTLSSSMIILENPHGYKLHLPASLSLEQLTKLFKLSGWNNA
jgi:hypothetical protein